jgi:2,3-bisphosphoglycerate-dependent phosphoglycerate mutase
MSLIIIRHGQSTYNLANLFTGNVDVPLKALGEAEGLAASVKIKEFSFNVAYTSMLITAQETMKIILTEIKQLAIPVIKNTVLD